MKMLLCAAPGWMKSFILNELNLSLRERIRRVFITAEYTFCNFILYVWRRPKCAVCGKPIGFEYVRHLDYRNWDGYLYCSLRCWQVDTYE